MLTNIDQGELRGHERRKDFFQERGTRAFFQNFSRGAQKWQNLLLPLETKKTTFFSKIFKISCHPFRQNLPVPPFDTHLRGRNMVNIHNLLTALLGWDKLSNDC